MLNWDDFHKTLEDRTPQNNFSIVFFWYLFPLLCNFKDEKIASRVKMRAIKAYTLIIIGGLIFFFSFYLEAKFN